MTFLLSVCSGLDGQSQGKGKSEGGVCMYVKLRTCRIITDAGWDPVTIERCRRVDSNQYQ